MFLKLKYHKLYIINLQNGTNSMKTLAKKKKSNKNLNFKIFLKSKKKEKQKKITKKKSKILK